MLCSISVYSQNNGLTFANLGENHIIVPNNSNINVVNNFTVEFWIRPSRIVGDWMAIATEGKCSNASFSYYIAINPDSLMNFRFSTDGVCDNARTYVSDTKLFPANCYHVAISYSSAGVKIYINGVLQPGHYVTGSYGGNLYSSNEPLIISAYRFYNGSLGSWYYGLLDDFRIWNKVLTPAEILNNYQTALAGNETGLKLYYKFDILSNGPGITVPNYASATGSILNGLTYSNDPSTPSVSPSCYIYVNIEDPVYNQIDFSVFPNPVKEICHIKSDGIISNIEVYNSLGKSIYFSPEIINNSAEIDFKNFDNGMYIIKIYSKENIITKKIFVD